MNKKKFFIGTIIIAIICFVSIYFFNPVLDRINYGLDLQGGFEVLYEVSPIKEGDKLNNDMLYSTYKAILKRIDILGVSEPEITIEGENRIRIKLAGIKDAESARNTISSTAVLTFRDSNDRLLMTSDVLGGNASVAKDEMGKPAVSLKIKDVDTFYEATKKVKDMTNNVMVIWLDFEEGVDSYKKEMNSCGSTNSHCLSAAYVEKAFASDVIIQGNFSKEEATSLVELINSGALPTRMTELSSRTVEASFGETALNKTLMAGMIGIVLVMVLLVIIYRFSGFIASVGLLLYTFSTFLVFYLIEGVLTLPGIAAILLGIGMAVDANIIIFERIKENLKIGTSLKDAYEIGNKTSFSSIIDANITTIIAAIIMFIFGESSVKGFSTMLIISIITTVLIMVYLIRFILKLFVNSGLFDKKLGLFIGINKKKIVKAKEIKIPYEKLNFVKHKYKFIVFTLLLFAIGIGFYFVSGANYGIDFTGGTSITLNEYSSEVESLLKDKNLTINKVNINSSSAVYYVRETLNQDEINDLSNIITNDYKLENDIYVVSKIVKQELVKNAFKSLLFAVIGIIIYVAIRFKFNYAISGIVALIHDVLFMFLFFTVFKIEIDSLFVASVLTIIGYSINDTIVTFDVIRENYKKIYKNNITDVSKLDDLVNISIRRTLFRNILTSCTTIIPVIVLMIFGSSLIFNFNIALLVGFIAGVYSSLFISNMIWLLLEKRRILKPVSDKDDDDDEIQELKVKGINC
ncbi:MAG: protein translocase subunit SecD [Bacilli bacterium]|nr:protein translocase subunit SecD [Bacilli bacterium]